MRSRWLVVALVFSCAVNLAALATIVFFWVSSPKKEVSRHQWTKPPAPESRPWVPREHDQELTKMMREFAEQTHKIRLELREKRRELILAVLEERPDTSKVMRLVDELAAHQARLERMTARHLLELKPRIDPERRDRFIKMFEERMMQDMQQRWFDRKAARFHREPQSAKPSPRERGRPENSDNWH